MYRIYIALLLFLFGSNAVWAQDAEVTFYSNGSVMAALSPVSKTAFYGNIFDGNRRLAYLKHGRFLSVHLSAGTHNFSAGYSSKHPAKNSLLSLNLEAGTHYFVRTTAHVVNTLVLGIEFQRGILEEVTCNTAHQEAGNDKPVKIKHVMPDVRSALDTSSGFPACY